MHSLHLIVDNHTNAKIVLGMGSAYETTLFCNVVSHIQNDLCRDASIVSTEVDSPEK